VAEWEGTHGYLWNAWNIDRTWYNQEVMLGTGGGWYGNAFGSTGGYTAAGQQLANSYYTANPDTITSRYNPNGKIDRSFYDVTDNGKLSQPEGLQPYYNTQWKGYQLYPQAKSETSNYVYVRDDNGDYVKDPSSASTTIFRAYAGSADDQLERYSRKQVLQTDGQGNLVYESCTDGEYVQNYEIVEDASGDLIHDIDIVSNDTDGKYALNYTWEAAADGTHYHPLVQTTKPTNLWDSDFDPSKYFKYENSTYSAFEFAWQINNYNGDLYTISDDYAAWDAAAADYFAGVNDTRYNKVHATDVTSVDSYHRYDASKDAGENRYDIIDNGYVAAISPDDDEKTHYSKTYIANSYRRATSADADEPRYCTVGQDYVSDTPIT
jgi:hypothetical protein